MDAHTGRRPYCQDRNSRACKEHRTAIAMSTSKTVLDALDAILRKTSRAIAVSFDGYTVSSQKAISGRMKIIFQEILDSLRTYVTTIVPDALTFKYAYTLICATMVKYLKTGVDLNKKAIEYMVGHLKTSYKTESFPVAAGTLYSIVRNNTLGKFTGCGSDAFITYNITEANTCEVEKVAYGQIGTVQSPCSAKESVYLPAFPFVHSVDKDLRRGPKGGGGGGGGDAAAPRPTVAPRARVGIAISAGGGRRSRSKSQSKHKKRYTKY